MAKHYGYQIRDVKRLTFSQIEFYMRNLPYVIETSKKFGKAPPAQPPAHSLVEFASRCGIQVPYNVRYDLGLGVDV